MNIKERMESSDHLMLTVLRFLCMPVSQLSWTSLSVMVCKRFLSTLIF
jgi:hypothetical protein